MSSGFEFTTVPVIPSVEEQLSISGHTVSDLGFKGDLLKVRLIARERITLAANTGTDRDSFSSVDWNGDVDGESRFMREAGITN